MAGGGFLGVDFFFVLSGFLITSILLNEHDTQGSIRLPAFYLRRAQRLMPALLLTIALFLAASSAAWPKYHETSGRDALLTALFLSDYGKAFWGMPVVLQHSWSLSVEEHFYLLWPLALIFLVRRLSPLGLVKAIIALFFAATVWRIACIWLGQDWTQIYYRFDTRMTGLIAGALIAASARAGTLPRPNKQAVIAALGVGLLALIFAPWGMRTYWLSPRPSPSCVP